MASTELFKVTCLTCQASLSVRNTALIGQIVGCPKCNSMVEITPPAPKPAPAPTPVVAAAAPAVSESVFEEDFETPAAEPTAEVESPAEITSVLESGATSSTKFILWAAASFVVGATITGMFLVLRSGATVDVAVSAPQTEAPVTATPVAEVEPTQREPVTVKTPDAAVISKEEAVSTTTANESSVEENPFDVKATEEEPPLTGEVKLPPQENISTEPAVTPTEAEQEPQKKLVIGSAAEPRVARKFDPLALDPEELNLNAVSEAGQGDLHAAAAEDQAAPGENQPQEEPLPVVVSTAVQLNVKAGGESGRRSAAVQLERSLPAVTVQDMPLLNFITFMGQLSGVPVSVTPEQLMMAGTTPGKPVSLNITETTLADALKSVLEPLHLEVVTDGPQIEIVRQDASKVRSVNYPIDDLLGSDTTAQQFADWIQTLVAPESWQKNGGDGQLTVSGDSLGIEQTQAVQYEVLFFLERIRLAKGLPLRSRYPKRLLSAKPYGVGIADRLNAPTTFTFSHDTPLAELFHHWQDEAGLPIFVDWPALATIKIWPDSLVTCRVANEPWHQALDTVLEPLGLGWRAAPGGAIQITSLARLQTEPLLDIYPAGTWHGDADHATVIDDRVNKLTYARAPARSN